MQAWSLRANCLFKQMTKDIPLVAVVTAVEVYKQEELFDKSLSNLVVYYGLLTHRL